jgi:two-component system, sensor histidine kinase and response regulator
MMGGQIGVESERGKGSTFWFTAAFEKQFPPTLSAGTKASSEARSAASARMSPAVLQSGGVVNGRSGRILVAEDNETNREVAIAILRKLGYEVDVVADGAQALVALRNQDYDAVLMDCAMPEMDGYEATRRIREVRTGTRNPLIPIVAMTADAMAEDREKCLRAGMSDYIAKPVEPRHLAEVLDKWVNPSSCNRANAPARQPSEKTEAVFRPEELLARLRGDTILAGRVLAGFVTDAPRQLLALKVRLEAGDLAGARFQAHTLKGAAAAVSAVTLQELCRQVQEAVSSGEAKGALALLPQLEEQFERLKTTVKQAGWV